jgi:hypothetical protein
VSANNRRLLARIGLLLVIAVPVAAAVPAGRYTYPSAGTVYDTMTKLTWQQAVPTATYSQTDAITYCAGLGATVGGSGWRLPTLKELATIVDESRANPAIDPAAFPATPTDQFWSSSSRAGDPTYGWTVTFSYGASSETPTKFVYHVRCVR